MPVFWLPMLKPSSSLVAPWRGRYRPSSRHRLPADSCEPCSRATEAVKGILKETPKANIKIVELDLTSLASVRAAAAEILALNIPIDVRSLSP